MQCRVVEMATFFFMTLGDVLTFFLLFPRFLQLEDFLRGGWLHHAMEVSLDFVVFSDMAAAVLVDEYPEEYPCNRACSYSFPLHACLS